MRSIINIRKLKLDRLGEASFSAFGTRKHEDTKSDRRKKSILVIKYISCWSRQMKQSIINNCKQKYIFVHLSIEMLILF